LTAIGLEFAGSVIGGLIVGHYLDEWLGTEPWLLLVCTFGGLLGAVLRMVQLVAKYSATRPNEDRDEPGRSG
jgi:ATP synthase protein I